MYTATSGRYEGVIHEWIKRIGCNRDIDNYYVYVLYALCSYNVIYSILENCYLVATIIQSCRMNRRGVKDYNSVV